MSNLFYPIVIAALSEDDGGGYLAYAPDLIGCMSDGDTPEEAVKNVLYAIKEWCDEMRRLGREIPDPGSAMEQSRKKRAALGELVRKQQQTIEAQKEALDRLQPQIASIKEEVDQLLAHLPEDPFNWDILPASSLARLKGELRH